MGRKTAVSSQRLKEIKIGAGVLYKNFNFDTMTGTVIGITRDGATFTVDREVLNMGMDGVRGKVKGARHIVEENATISASILSWSKDLFLNALPGSTAANFPTVGPTHEKITCAADITDGDHIENVVMEVRNTNGGFDYFAVTDALCDGGLEVATQDKDGAASALTFSAHYDPDNTELAPWAIYRNLVPASVMYTLTYTAGANGTIVGLASQQVASGGSGTAVYAAPNDGYQFVSWSDDGPNPRTDSAVVANLTVSATFAVV